MSNAAAAAAELGLLLERQIARAQALAGVLEAEAGHLASRDLANVGRVAEQKQQLIEALQTESARLDALLDATGARVPNERKPDIDRLAAFPGLAGPWRELNEILGECRTRNAGNGIVISTVQRFGDRLTRLITGQSLSPTTYGPRGRTGGEGTALYSTRA